MRRMLKLLRVPSKAKAFSVAGSLAPLKLCPVTKALAILLIGSIVGTASAQQVGTNSAQGKDETFKLTLNSQLVVEQVVVKDKSGKFVSGLTAKDFTVTEDGNAQTVKICEQQHFS